MSKVTYKVLMLKGLVAMAIATNAMLSIGAEPITATNDVVFQAVPESCVVVRKGQTCHLDVRLSWQAKQPNHFCIVEVSSGKRLRCWKEARSGELNMRYKAVSSQRYQLIDVRTSIIAAELVIPVAWVYQNDYRSRASWRLF